MTLPSTSSYDWVREIQPNLKNLDSIPLTGAAPPFPWEDFSSRLSRAFDREGLNIQPGEISWCGKEDLYKGLGEVPYPLIFSVPPLKGHVCWVMPAQEIALLAAFLLTKQSHPLDFYDPELQEGFYRFLALEVLYHFSQTSFDKTLFPILTPETILPDEDSLVWNLSIHLEGHAVWGRLIISPEFRRSLVQYFAEKGSPQISEKMAQTVDIIVHVEAGKAHLTLKEWQAVEEGDFILLDSCSLDSEHLDGRVMLTVNSKRVFRAKLKEGTLKILELPLLHEVDSFMEKQPENSENEDLSDLDLSEDESEDEDLFEDEDENLLTEQEPKILSEPQEIPSVAAQKPKPPIIATEDIPMTLTVEIGQIQMPMDRLLKLEPGNLLEIDIHPENGVDLTINGKVVARGELIRVGETIGVRLLHLGKK